MDSVGAPAAIRGAAQATDHGIRGETTTAVSSRLIASSLLSVVKSLQSK